MSAPPRITVLLSVRNGMPYLPEAVRSVLAQTFTDFELLVVDDGSTDGTAAWLASIDDARLRVLRHATSRGLIASLNEGLDQARAPLIARMDADDICAPERLALQHAHLARHAEIGVLGSAFVSFDETASRLVTTETSHEALSAALLFDSSLAHPTVMMRASPRLRYDPAFVHAEDYELWSRARDRVRLAALPAPLLRYRRHPGQVSTAFLEQQRACGRTIRLRELRRLGIEPTDEQLRIHQLFSTGEWPADLAFVDSVAAWLALVVETNARTGKLDPRALARACASRFFALAYARCRLGKSVWRAYWRHPVASSWRPPLRVAASFARWSLVPGATP